MQSLMKLARAGATRGAVRSSASSRVQTRAASSAKFKPVRNLSVEPQVEGGLRGVVGTLSLVESDALYVEAWVPDGDGLRCGDAWVARDAEGFAGVRKVW